MRCPADNIDMMVMEYKQIEIDFCHKCSGIWFDRGELELLLKNSAGGSTGIPALSGAAEETRSYGKRKCPICGKKMREVGIGEPNIEVDICSQGDGIWFDGGELQELLKQVAAGKTGKYGDMKDITAFLGDTFQIGK
jgi:Zn-finger nucleic acid-binding protein